MEHGLKLPLPLEESAIIGVDLKLAGTATMLVHSLLWRRRVPSNTKPE